MSNATQYNTLVKSHDENEMVTIEGETQEWCLWVLSAENNADETEGCVAYPNGTDEEQENHLKISLCTLAMYADQS